MIIGSILVVLLALCIWVYNKAYNWRYDVDVLGGLGGLVFGVYLLVHIIESSMASYDYNSFVVQRDSFVSTLKISRESGREIESAAIVEQISYWNQSLAKKQYSNSLFMLDDYYDDRIDLLKPIK